MLTAFVLAAHLARAAQPAPVDVQQPDAPVTWVFEWRAPVGCPTRDELVADILSYVTGAETPATEATRAKLRIEVDVDARAETWRARMRLSGGEGNSSRSFEAPDCASLARAVALVSAVTLDPVLVADKLELDPPEPDLTEPTPDLPEPAPEPRPESRPPPGSSPATEPGPPAAIPQPGPSLAPPVQARADAKGSRPFVLLIGLGGGGGWGPLDRGSAALSAALGLGGRRWRALVVGGWSPPITARLSDDRGGRLSGWWMGARGCFVARVESAPLAFPACAGVEAGQLLARGVAPTTNIQSGAQLWVSTQLSQGLRWQLRGPLALSLDAALLVPLVRARFLIGDAVLASVSPVGFRATLGFELRV